MHLTIFRFGTRRKSPFIQKTIYLSPDFKLENYSKEFKLADITILISQIGGGIVVKDPNVAEIVLKGKQEDATKYGSAKTYTWNSFFDMVQPYRNDD